MCCVQVSSFCLYIILPMCFGHFRYVFWHVSTVAVYKVKVRVETAENIIELNTIFYFYYYYFLKMYFKV